MSHKWQTPFYIMYCRYLSMWRDIAADRYIFTKLHPRSPVIVQVLPLLYWSPSPLVQCLRYLRCLRCLRCLASRDDCSCSRPTSCWRHCHGLSHPGLLQFVTTLQYNQLPAPVTWNCRMYTAVALWEICEIQQDKSFEKILPNCEV